MLQVVQDTLLPLTENDCTRIASKADNVLHGRTFKYSLGQSIRIILTKPQWKRFKRYLTISQDAAAKTADVTRNNAVNDSAPGGTIQIASTPIGKHFVHVWIHCLSNLRTSSALGTCLYRLDLAQGMHMSTQ
jgi:hypothetical protein